ncbi:MULTISPECIES: hypothetical protein [Ramlibacter]|uniref:Ubiquinone biosynthesis protein UbiJ n=1 Tax=Ramlibacter aquaticus TaxID=2780094 RepID=A0ABR9SB11_9BURK|nr:MULTISPECIES: hypothetical protein [Ramlibacter]MBE7939533.1 hypothetical protein [Ramlibacter aquaticus]
MASESPTSFLDDVFGKLAAGLQPPPWMVSELQHRIVLLVNHVLMQEPEAQARLARQAGRVLEARWRHFFMRLAATPAGLLELSETATPADLSLTVIEESPFQLAQAALRGDKPPVRIEGDVQFAAEVNWLADNVRWDLEDDLARVMGDVPAHALAEGVRRLVAGLRDFAGRRGAGAAGPAA